LFILDLLPFEFVVEDGSCDAARDAGHFLIRGWR
jgi:hypothetical protein